MKAKIISAFPGCGKTYSFNHQEEQNVSILDSDSSEFTWLKDEKGNLLKERNPDFPNNYIKHIKENIDKVDIIFVSSHKQVRDALKENNLEYFLIYPHIDQKDRWLKIFEQRGSFDTFIKFINDNWDNFIYDIKKEDFPHKIELPYNKSYYIDNTLLLGIINGFEKK